MNTRKAIEACKLLKAKKLFITGSNPLKNSGFINNFLKLNENSSIFKSIQKCKTFVGESIPVVKDNGEILGVVSEGDLFQIFLKVNYLELYFVYKR